VWNIGADGQFYMGALAGGAFAMSVPLASPVLMVPATLFVGAVGGAMWGWMVAQLRVRWQVSEVISSLLLNYIAVLFFSYCIRGPLRDPATYLPVSPVLPPSAGLPAFTGLNVHLGLVLAILLVPAVAYLLNATPFGFRAIVTGHNPEAARVAGIDVHGTIMRVMLLSGGLAGLAGVMQVMAVNHRLQQGISSGFGFTAIVVALLGRNRPLGVLVAGLFVAGLTVGGQAMQLTEKIPSAAVASVEAFFVIFLLIADQLGRRV
jgi:simple sugar transport system permease protein